MTRKIKFRGKQAYGGADWKYGNLCGTPFYTKIEEVIKDKECEKTFWTPCTQVIPETIGQFTGLLDKNGKEIYEGDILRGDRYPFNCDGVDNYLVEIVWCDNVCGFYMLTHKKPNAPVRGISRGNWEQLEEDDIKSFEVIGNIYDNPELIKD